MWWGGERAEPIPALCSATTRPPLDSRVQKDRTRPWTTVRTAARTATTTVANPRTHSSKPPAQCRSACTCATRGAMSCDTKKSRRSSSVTTQPVRSALQSNRRLRTRARLSSRFASESPTASRTTSEPVAHRARERDARHSKARSTHFRLPLASQMHAFTPPVAQPHAVALRPTHRAFASNRRSRVRTASMSLGPLSFLLRPRLLNDSTTSAPSLVDDRGASSSTTTSTAAASEPQVKLSSPDLAAELRARIQDLYVDHVTADGVDYDALRASTEFYVYKDTVARLVDFDPYAELTTDATRIAFYVNLYNALTIHAFAELGPPAASSLSRLLFNTQASYCVGGHVLSLSDIENGLLRGNRGVSLWPKPFAETGDARLDLCVDQVDPRIHFVLNCGATSCPPIRYLVADKLDQQLSLATVSFFRSPANLSLSDANIEAGSGVVTTSAILKWYRDDFAPDGTDAQLLNFIVAHGKGASPAVDELARLLETNPSATDITIRYAPYDWSLNSSKATG